MPKYYWVFLWETAEELRKSHERVTFWIGFVAVFWSYVHGVKLAVTPAEAEWLRAIGEVLFFGSIAIAALRVNYKRFKSKDTELTTALGRVRDLEAMLRSGEPRLHLEGVTVSNIGRDAIHYEINHSAPRGHADSSAQISAKLREFHISGTKIFHAGHAIESEDAWHSDTWEWYDDLATYLKNHCGSKVFVEFNTSRPTEKESAPFAELPCGGDLAQLADSLRMLERIANRYDAITP